MWFLNNKIGDEDKPLIVPLFSPHIFAGTYNTEIERKKDKGAYSI